jgi:CheY-like chemotaxis protein
MPGAAAGQEDPSGPLAAPVRKVLLAEDQTATILLLTDFLDLHGYQIIVAHDGEEAVEKAQRCQPDLILMDIQMPVMDGLEATLRLRRNPDFARTPIIALTALAMPGDRERCLQAGANEYLSKPVSLRTLSETIEKLLKKA